MDLQSILNKIITDTELYNKFVSLNSQEEIYKFLNDNGYSESYEFFCEQLDNVKNDFALESLDNSELDEVSGGANLKQVFKAGGAGLLASAMAFGGLGANAKNLSDQCIDLASQISSRQNPNITIINNYDKGIVSKATTTIGTILLIKHIANLFNNKIGNEVLVGFISSYIDYMNIRAQYTLDLKNPVANPSEVNEKLQIVIKSIESLAQKNGISASTMQIYQDSLNKLKNTTNMVELVSNDILNCLNSVLNIDPELTKNLYNFENQLLNDLEKQKMDNKNIKYDSKVFIEMFLKNPKTASQELTKLFNGNNDQSKKFESQDNQDYSYDKIHSNTLANFGECYKNCIITCYRGNIVSGNPINPLIGSIKDLADNYGVSNFTYYQEYLNKLVEMSKNNDYNIDDLIMNTKSCFAFIDNENIKSLETDIYEYGINLHQKLSDNVYINEDIPALFTDGMRDVARELKPLFENCYRAYWRYYNGRKDQTKDPYNTDRYTFENNLRSLMDNKYFEQLVSFKSRNELWNEHETKILNSRTDDGICSILSDIWDNIRKLIQDNSDIENGSQISRKARESTGFKYATQNTTNLSNKKTEETSTGTRVDTKLFNSNVLNELYNECKIDEAIEFFGNTNNIPTSEKCQKDIMPFMYNIRDSIYVIKNILDTMNSDKYKETVDKLNMSNDLKNAVENLESCREITSSAIQIFLFNDKQDETAKYLVHDWLINKVKYNNNLSTAIEFINNFFNSYNSKFNITNLKNNFEKYNKILEQCSQEDWYWYHGKDDPKTKEFEEKFKKFEETNDYMLELCKLRNEYMKNHFLYNYRPLFEKFEQLLDKYNVDISDLNYVHWILNFDGKSGGTPQKLLKKIQKDEYVKQREYLENLWTKTFKK